ncbi:hypothetical protein BH11PLA2_BH11PLA2_52020 [soil metagenome]
MSTSIKDKVADAGQTVADTAKTVGNKIAENAKDALNWAENKTGLGCGTARGCVEERMDVIASCGKKIGVVDHVDGKAIKLTKKDSAGGQHHFIPTDWVDHVDNHVHLKKNSVEAETGWKSEAAECGCAG